MSHNYPAEYNKIITNPMTELDTYRLTLSDSTISNIDNVNISFILFKF
jgi:hypothetical protein